MNCQNAVKKVSEYLEPDERQALEEFSEDRDAQLVSESFLAHFFPRLLAHLEQRFESVDLDAAFLIQESEDLEHRPFREFFWDEGELTPLGERFLSWVEDPGGTELQLVEPEFLGFLQYGTEALRALAPQTAEVTEEDTEAEAVSSETEVSGLGPVEEERQGDTDTEEDSVALEPESFEGETELAEEDLEEPEDTEPEEFDAEEEAAEPEPSSEKSDPDLSEQETLALGALARAAVARAEREAVRRERIEAILKTTLEPTSQILQSQFEEGDALVEEVAEVAVAEEPPAVPHDRRTQLREQREHVEEEEEPDGEELEFSRAPSSPFEKKNQLIVKNKFLGYGKNTEGVVGLCGQLTVRYFDEEELVGRLESSNPLLFLFPSRLSGTKTTVTYWLPPIAFPHPAGHLSIKTKNETKTLALHALFPKSRTDYMRDRHVVMALLAPAFLGCLYFGFVYYVTASGVAAEAQRLFPDLYEAALAGIQGVDFRTGGLGLYQLQVIPASESLQMIWASILLLAPLASSKFFHFLSRSRKRHFGGTLAAGLLAPSLLLLVAWNFQGLALPIYEHRDFLPLDLQGFLAWGLPVNVAVAAYLFLSNFGVWDRWIKVRELRLALPFVLVVIYLTVMFVLIYGRSWFS